jgi:hypothetical protein
MVRKPFTPKQFSSIAGVQEETMDGAESSTNFKRKILKVIKDLTNTGKHKEANDLYQKYFGGTNGKN